MNKYLRFVFVVGCIYISSSSAFGLTWVGTVSGNWDGGSIQTIVDTGLVATGNSTGIVSSGIVLSGAYISNKTILNTGYISSKTSLQISSGFVISGDLYDDIEYVNAVQWMYNQGITYTADVYKYRPYDQITRQELAKMMTQLYKSYMYPNASNSGVCDINFSDTSKFSSDLSDYIYEVCRLGIMKGGNNKFDPNGKVTRAQIIAILIRMLDDHDLDQSMDPWYMAYISRAVDIGLIKPGLTSGTLAKNITRYEMALMINRVKILHKLYKISSEDILGTNDLAKTLDTTSLYDDIGNRSAKLNIDNQKLNSGNINKALNLYLRDRQYIVVGSKITYISNTSNIYQWMGYIRNIDSTQNIGIISMTMHGSKISEGYIRPYTNSNIGDDKYFEIYPDMDNSCYRVYEKYTKPIL